jgi:hypothetical protein
MKAKLVAVVSRKMMQPEKAQNQKILTLLRFAGNLENDEVNTVMIPTVQLRKELM